MQTGARTTAVQDDGADSGTLHRSNHFKPAIPLPLIPDATVDGFVVKLDTVCELYSVEATNALGWDGLDI